MAIFPPHPLRLSPATPFTIGNDPIGITVTDFWQWAFSNLMRNELRGVVAEFLVAHALGLTHLIRDSWGHADLVTEAGLSIEVKATGYLQAWVQQDLSPPRWTGLTARESENTDEGKWRFADEPTVKGELVVMCLHSATDHGVADPLNIDQWLFWLVPAAQITTNSMRLSTVERGYTQLKFSDLRPSIWRFENIRS